MLIQSFENKSNLAELFEHRNHYSVVVTRHKDNKRTEYKLQKTDYVYDMLKVKGSVTALVNCAKDLIVNFSYISPTVTTDTKSESAITRDSVGVVESEGEALLQAIDYPAIYFNGLDSALYLLESDILHDLIAPLVAQRGVELQEIAIYEHLTDTEHKEWLLLQAFSNTYELMLDFGAGEKCLPQPIDDLPF